jgi:hypothetical protein
MFGGGFLCFVRHIRYITWNMVRVKSSLEVCWGKVHHEARYLTCKCRTAFYVVFIVKKNAWKVLIC